MGRDRRIWMLVIAAAVIVVDRWTKLWVVAHVVPRQPIVVIQNVFRITNVVNTGAAFSMFENMNEKTVRNLLVAFSIAAVIVVLALLWKLGRQFTITSVGLALILGGALGNLYDRVKYEHVVDFLEVHIVHYHWPDFNIADSCIVVGACLLLLEILWPHKARD